MLERIVASGLYVQVIVMLLVAAVLWVYWKLIWRTRWFGIEHLNDKAWYDSHKARVFFIAGIPVMAMQIILEEIIFRAPLILAFERWDRKAWPWVALSSILFGFIHFIDHWPTLTHSMSESVKNEAGTEVNDIHERLRIVKERVPISRAFRIWRGFGTGCLGAGLAYIGITHQSLYWAVGVHFLWNVGLITVFPVLVLLLMIPYHLVLLGGELIMERVDTLQRWYRRKRRQHRVKRQGINLLR